MEKTHYLATALVWGASHWLIGAAAFALVFVALLVWGYRVDGPSLRVRLLAAALKAAAVVLLALCLLEPLASGTRAKPAANQFVLLMDNSGSMTLRDRGGKESRGETLKALAGAASPWVARLAADFDLRQYLFDAQLKAVPAADAVTLDGGASNLGAALDRLARRYQGRPLAGVLLFTDGNATDADAVERYLAQIRAKGEGVVPIYPVVLGADGPAADINLERVSVTQTNFEDAPVTLAAQVAATGFKGRNVTAELLDEASKSVEQQQVVIPADGEPQTVRFRVKPDHPGVSFYKVKVAEAATGSPLEEATAANNTRTVAVDRGQGPYRVLYVAGRPNWEYKFLQRAVTSDEQVQLVGLIRVAKREPKFNFIGKGEAFNPLFRGFDNKTDDSQQYDQPVLVRVSTEDETELRAGFPKTAEELYRYNAVVLDDLESEFFTTDQMALLKEFVRQRGGGLLMLGGQESFKNGKYDRTPVGDLLPVYVDEAPPVPADAQWRMELTREGWLEPWMRLRPEEAGERERLAAMPPFETLNTARGIKPGATVLARAQAGDGGPPVPALVEQRFGRGRAAALLVGDLWRWDLRRPANTPSDLQRAWRQTIRWLVADVPRRVEITLAPPTDADDAPGAVRLDVRARDPAYAPLDNAAVTLHVTGPDAKPVDLTAEPSDREPGLYQALFVPRQSGAYRADAKVAGADGTAAGTAATGWTADPAAEEFQRLAVNRDLLDRLAKGTGGETVAAADLDSFVAGLPARKAPIVEPYIRPLWHQAWVFLLAIAFLTAEWGIRRWQGLV